MGRGRRSTTTQCGWQPIALPPRTYEYSRPSAKPICMSAHGRPSRNEPKTRTGLGCLNAALQPSFLPLGLQQSNDPLNMRSCTFPHNVPIHLAVGSGPAPRLSAGFLPPRPVGTFRACATGARLPLRADCIGVGVSVGVGRLLAAPYQPLC